MARHSDGRANLGETDAGVIGEYAGGEDEDGIYLLGVGTGKTGADAMPARLSEV